MVLDTIKQWAISDAQWATKLETALAQSSRPKEQLMGLIITQIQELNVYTIVYNNDKILILKRPNDLWEFAGGGVDFGEQPVQAAARELKEETTLIATDLSFIGVTSATFQKDGNEKHAIYLIYKGTVNSDRVIISGEHKEARWVTAYELKFIKLALNAEAALEFLQ